MMFRAAAVLAVAAVIVLLVFDGTAATAVFIGLASIAGVLAVSGVFYAIGRGEDDARARGE